MPSSHEFRTSQRLPWPYQLRERPQWEIPGGSRGRSNSPGSTFDAHSAAQTPLLPLPLQITASCCTWDKSMVGNDCSPKALGSCVILTVGPARSVAPYGRGDATDAVSATAIHHFGNFGLGTPFRTVGSLGIRTKLRGGTSIDQQLLQNSQPVHPGEPLDDGPLPNCPIRNVVLTDRDKQLLSELRQASAMALPRCVVSRYATAWAESLKGAMSGHQSLGCSSVTDATCSSLKSRKVSTGTPS